MEINNYVSWASHFKKQDLDHLVCLALELPGLWVEAWSWFPNGGLWEGSCLLMFHGVRSSLVVQSPGLGSPLSGISAQPLGFQHQDFTGHTEDITPRLKVKEHPTAKNTQRDSHTYKGKGREKKMSNNRSQEKRKRSSQ